jgi:predicted negative regulator of RcsB-dependent stress response
MSTTPATSQRALSDDDPIGNFILWSERYSRVLTAIAVALVLALGAWMLYGRSKAIKVKRSEDALARAAQSLGSGNIPLAQSDFEKLIVRYKGTPSAAQAAMLLAQTYYEAGKPQQGIDRLTKVQKDVGKTFQPSVEALLGDGYDLLGKPLEAAKHYREAAARTPYATDKANYLASAARALTLGGEKAQAVTIWTDLASDPESPVAGEARVRLGELTSTPARGS